MFWELVGKMSKKSKKRKRKKLSSSSSEEDEKASKEQDVSNRHQSVKRRKESCASKQEKSSSSTIKVSQSTREIKMPLYRQAATQATNQKPVNKAEEYTKTQSVSLPFYKTDCSGKKRHYVSEKDSTGRGRISKPLGTDTPGTVPQKTETIAKGRLDSKRSPSKLKNITSVRLASAEQKEQRQRAKKKRGAEESQRTGNDTIVVKNLLRQKRREVVKMMDQRHRHNDLRAKRSLCTETKTLSASMTNQPSTNRHTTSDSSAKVMKNVITIHRSVTSVSQKTAKSLSLQQQIDSLTPSLPRNFKIPKKVQLRPAASTSDNRHAVSAKKNLNDGTELPQSGASMRSSKQDAALQHYSYLDVTPSSSSEGQDKKLSLSPQLPTVSDTEPCYDQIQVVEQLHLARTEKKFEVNVMQSYGELTCMDIDPPEEGATELHRKQPTQQNLILVLDTNILLSHLDYVKKIRSRGLGALGFPVVLIPWVVLQELDSLKRGKGLSGSVAHLATPAISYIYNSLKSQKTYLWGQSMQQAAESIDGLNAENNDDRVLQCCLQYQSLYTGCAVILCTNDKNLCSKALLSGVKALSKNDLEAELCRSRCGFNPLQNTEATVMPHTNLQISSPVLSRSCTSAQPHSPKRTGLSVGLVMKHNQQLCKGAEEKTNWDLGRYVSELEDSLQEVLSDVLEVEMKAAYEDLWLEIVYLKPPWTLQDVLQCLKKHWIAVFGHIVPRRKQQIVLNLIEFFNSGKTIDCSGTLTALQEAKELVKAFEKSSSRVTSAITVMDNIFNKLQLKGESPACDVVMNDDDDDEEEKQPLHVQVSHQEVWALFENIWSNVYQISLEVFKVLGFDPHTMQSALPAGGPPPPQDAFACLHKLSSMVSQLLEAFSSVLLSAPSLEEIQALLSIIHSNKIVNVDSRLTAVDLLDCFSQQDYREKLRVGGIQLMELKAALDCCVGAMGQNLTFAM